MPMSARDDGRAVLDAVNGMRRQQGLPPFERVDQALADYVDIALDLYRERLDNVLRMQIALDALGFNPGPIDGLLGPRTTAAIKKYQQTTAMPITGQLTDEQIDALEASSMDRVMAKKPGG
jgi:peptidoglycan hydrolase-like protein with peptidoglycan-binding domain